MSCHAKNENRTEDLCESVLLFFPQFSLGAVHCGLSCAFNDVSPNYSSVLFTIGMVPTPIDHTDSEIFIFERVFLIFYPGLTGNTAGACAGIIGPIVVSACIDSLEEGDRLISTPLLLSCINNNDDNNNND